MPSGIDSQFTQRVVNKMKHVADKSVSYPEDDADLLNAKTLGNVDYADGEWSVTEQGSVVLNHVWNT